ncbi:IS110 family transposase [Actinoplanes sp. CA-030573]|uniref:IS110 family transposase n=1 Tax=Actinoplanes sp. CA-030573 TaxID=3239898 RepID=UPI003D8ABC75
MSSSALTRTNTHTAAVVSAATGAVLAEKTVTADPAGYRALVEIAERHGTLRAWVMEGSGGYGAGLALHLAQRDELVVELDRPKRRARKAGAKSDPIDAVRAARRCRACGPAAAAHSPPGRGRCRRRRPKSAARARGYCPRAGPGLIPWPVYPRRDHVRAAAASRARRRRRACVHRDVDS